MRITEKMTIQGIMTRKITIVLDRLRSAHNVGNIFRIAEALDAEIIGCGYTPLPPHDKLKKTAMGCCDLVKFRHAVTSVEAIKILREEGYAEILAVESGFEETEAWARDYKFPLALVFGNEALGIDAEAIKLCDGVVSLPMFGNKCSINVGNSVAAVLYAVEAKSRKK